MIQRFAVDCRDMIVAHIDAGFVLIPDEAAELIDARLKDQLIG